MADEDKKLKTAALRLRSSDPKIRASVPKPILRKVARGEDAYAASRARRILVKRDNKFFGHMKKQTLF